PRSVSAGAKEFDRSKAGRTGRGAGSAAADNSVVVGCAEAKCPGTQRQGGIESGQRESASEARPEDGVMVPQVLPMLAIGSEPFDAPEYCFEIQYDGVRALAAVEGSGWRLWVRERAEYTTRYPELDVLRRLPTGTLVDGELVAFDADGRPHLRRLLR